MQVPTTGAKPSLKEISKTRSSVSCPTVFAGTNQHETLATYESVILANGDVCSVGDWVFVASNGTESAICCVEEILSRAPGGQAPNAAEGVLLRCGSIGDFSEPYSMPTVTATDQFLFLPPAVRLILCPPRILIQYCPGSTLHSEHPT